MRAFRGAGHFTPPGRSSSHLATNGPAFTRDGAAKARLRDEEAGTARALVLILPTFRVAGGSCVACCP